MQLLVYQLNIGWIKERVRITEQTLALNSNLSMTSCSHPLLITSIDNYKAWTSSKLHLVKFSENTRTSYLLESSV